MLFSDSKKTGVICGLSIVLFLLVIWVLQKELLWNPWVFNLTWLPCFYFVFIGVKNYSLQNSEAEFRDLVREGFVVYLIAQILYYLFYYLLFYHLDPGLLELQVEIELRLLEESRGILGEDRADEMIRNLQDGIEKPGPGSLFRQFVPSLLPGFVLAAVFALIVKKAEY